MKRAALLLALLVLFSPYLGNASQAFAQCGTPVPTWTPTPTYEQVVLGVQSAHLIAYFPLTETSGTVANELTGNVGDGAYTGVTLNATTFVDGTTPAPSFDGIDDYVNIFSSALASAWNSNSYTVMAWFKTATWSESSFKFVVSLRGSSYLAQVAKYPTANMLDFTHSGSTEITYEYSGTNWTFAALTRDVAANVEKVYLNGAEIDSRAAPSSALTLIAASIGRIATGTNYVWLGSIAHVAIWNAPLSSTDVTALYNVPSSPPPTPTTQPTCTPTPTDTPSPTPTHSPTPTPTITPTADVDQYWTAPPPETTGTPEPGQPYKFSHSANAGQVVIVVFLAAILFTIWAVFLIARRRRQK